MISDCQDSSRISRLLALPPRLLHGHERVSSKSSTSVIQCTKYTCGGPPCQIWQPPGGLQFSLIHPIHPIHPMCSFYPIHLNSSPGQASLWRCGSYLVDLTSIHPNHLICPIRLFYPIHFNSPPGQASLSRCGG